MLVQNKSKLVVPVAFAVETERSLCPIAGDFGPGLRSAFSLMRFDYNFLRFKNHCASLITQLHSYVVIEVIGRWATTYVS